MHFAAQIQYYCWQQRIWVGKSKKAISKKMKLLESGRLEALSRALSILNGDSVVQGRVESYSCKMAGNEKAFYKRFTAAGETTHDLQALSPPEGVTYR